MGGGKAIFYKVLEKDNTSPFLGKLYKIGLNYPNFYYDKGMPIDLNREGLHVFLDLKDAIKVVSIFNSRYERTKIVPVIVNKEDFVTAGLMDIFYKTAVFKKLEIQNLEGVQ